MAEDYDIAGAEFVGVNRAERRFAGGAGVSISLCEGGFVGAVPDSDVGDFDFRSEIVQRGTSVSYRLFVDNRSWFGIP